MFYVLYFHKSTSRLRVFVKHSGVNCINNVYDIVNEVENVCFTCTKEFHWNIRIILKIYTYIYEPKKGPNKSFLIQIFRNLLNQLWSLNKSPCDSENEYLEIIFLAYFKFLKKTLLSALCQSVCPSRYYFSGDWPILLVYGSVDN